MLIPGKMAGRAAGRAAGRLAQLCCAAHGWAGQASMRGCSHLQRGVLSGLEYPARVASICCSCCSCRYCCGCWGRRLTGVASGEPNWNRPAGVGVGGGARDRDRLCISPPPTKRPSASAAVSVQASSEGRAVVQPLALEAGVEVEAGLAAGAACSRSPPLPLARCCHSGLSLQVRSRCALGVDRPAWGRLGVSGSSSSIWGEREDGGESRGAGWAGTAEGGACRREGAARRHLRMQTPVRGPQGAGTAQAWWAGTNEGMPSASGQPGA